MAMLPKVADQPELLSIQANVTELEDRCAMALGLRLAILGWGSLLWESHAAFDERHGPWESDGPTLKLEFSRVSSSRLGALTLVIDPDNGWETQVSYCMSARKTLDDAVADLRCREGTVLKNIGFFQAANDQHRCRDKDSLAAISKWAEGKHVDAVVWTDLPSNFEKKYDEPFSVKAAIAHIQKLDRRAKVRAAEYIWRAPSFVKTALRTETEVNPWFGQS